jgi:acetolactate synthase-1/2/3 large subunit
MRPKAMRARPARSACVLVTSGPGATNAVTGLTDALMDSIPIVCITGQVPTHLIGTDAFQEADTTGITRPCTKHNYLVKTSTICRGACTRPSTSRTGRPGPVVIDIPKDIQFAIRRPYRGRPIPSTAPTKPQHQGRWTIEAAVELMAQAKRRSSTPAAASSTPARKAPAKLLRELVRDRLPDHLDPDGPRRLSGLG